MDKHSDVWIQRLSIVKKYIDINKQLPTQKNNNDHNINKLGQWINAQNKKFKHNLNIMKNEHIKQLWIQFKKDYYVYFSYNNYNIKKWKENLSNCIDFINTYNYIPSRKNNNNNKYIKKLAYWLTEQQQNYKNKKYIMNNHHIKKLYEDFIKYIKTNKHNFNFKYSDISELDNFEIFDDLDI